MSLPFSSSNRLLFKILPVFEAGAGAFEGCAAGFTGLAGLAAAVAAGIAAAGAEVKIIIE